MSSSGDLQDDSGDPQGESAPPLPPSHVRTDSVLSADSFVLEESPQQSERKTAAVRDEYFSPSSSSAMSVDSTNRTQLLGALSPATPTLSMEPQQHTGNSSSEAVPRQQNKLPLPDSQLRNRLNSDGVTTIESDSVPPIQPAIPFLAQTYANTDDSDVSDGSIVFNYTHEGPSAAVNQQSLRDRFPSFDSAASSGSIVKKTVPSSTKPSASMPAASQKQILPYHERRKLMKQRQQQQQQQQSRSREPAPPRPGRQPHQMQPPQPGMPYVMPPQPYPPDLAYYQQPPPGAMMQSQPFPPYGGMPNVGMPMPPPNYPFSPQQPAYMGGLYAPFAPQQPPPPVNRRRSPYQSRGKKTEHASSQQRQPPRQFGQAQQQQSYPVSGQYVRSPAQPPSQSGGSSYGLNSGSASFDSSDEPQGAQLSADAAPSRHARRGNRDGLPPPPPPPLVVPPETHIRVDSTGSVSSLGSFERSGKEEGSDPNNGETKGFFGRLQLPWSEQQLTVDAYHKRNQAFLSKVERRNASNSQSPQIQPRKVSLSTMHQPPPTFGGHRRLNSIENDDWTESDEQNPTPQQQNLKRDDNSYGSSDDESSTMRSPSGALGIETGDRDTEFASERTKLLPPSGISSNEYYDRSNYRESRSGRMTSSQQERFQLRETVHVDNRGAARIQAYNEEQADRRRRKKKKKHRRRSRRAHQRPPGDLSESSSLSSTSTVSRDRRLWLDKQEDLIERERAKFIEQWKKEAREEQERKRWYRRCCRSAGSWLGDFRSEIVKYFRWGRFFIANLPPTVGAIALASANLGVDWFKFAEENMESCSPVHFHSAQCSFPEFPGCFYCDTNATMYKVALRFHFACSVFAGLLASSFLAKLIFARKVLIDELNSPTTAAPAGLICMTLDVVFAGRGTLGMFVVSASSCIHLCLAIWFIYMALAYHTMPEPSWFPNTTGIGISAVKIWLYYPMAGHFLMAISLSLNIFFFPISLIRVAINRKISATVGWMQMSAPNISLYALTIMAQPSFKEEHPDINNFEKVHRMVYLPCMHFFFSLCIIGMVASIHSLVVRWRDFRKIPFSPAHAAFCCPTLSHANALQAYRNAVLSFSDLPRGHWYLLCLDAYWMTALIGGTIVTIIISSKFLASLPEWTHFNLEDEIEPPQPNETSMALTSLISTGETMRQPFVSPAILQANETGKLYLTSDLEGRPKYKRTRRVTALGFEPIMEELQMQHERELLLEWVGKNPPRRRNRTLSVPGIPDFRYGASFGTGNSGVYGMEEARSPRWARRQRSTTLSPGFVDRHHFDP